MLSRIPNNVSQLTLREFITESDSNITLPHMPYRDTCLIYGLIINAYAYL